MPFLISVFLLSGCSSETNLTNHAASNHSSSMNKKIVELPIKKVINNQQIRENASFTATSVVKKVNVSGGTVYLYSKKDDLEHVYGAYETTENQYDLGIVGGLYSHMDDEILSIKELTLNGRTLLCIKGTFGANAPVQNYYLLEQNKIYPFLTVDTGHAEILDLDKNGVQEIVSTHGAPMQVHLYTFDNSDIWVTNVNEALHATNVNVDNTGIFLVSHENSKLIEEYRYDAGQFAFINNIN
ncbi:hypothetical protein D3P08_20345 [Paenibacillus nanensis]|uniref:Uncharacterized protein n=1 Tax=Paenibacillus nanensis TaxID=393251 RepID=A0A3A1UQX4_9BACL|nr:hypothetical protein [Paenibacillus nanensis]RIX50206.1 hypothetical protein D3P08_20345 [Paenibacillus nanensis]